MSDRIVLLNHGRIEQTGRPAELYFHPRSLFAAEFLGDSNILDAEVTEANGTVKVRTTLGPVLEATEAVERGVGRPVKVMVRPENVALLRPGETSPHPNRLRGEVVDHLILGGGVKSYVRLADGTTMAVQELNRAERERVAPGTAAELAFASADTLVLPPGESARQVRASGA